MLKRIGLFTAALFATLALMQLPTASAQNRGGNGGYGYNTHQTSSYDQSSGQHGNSYASQNGSGDNRQPSGYGSNHRQQNVYNNDGRSNVYASNNRQLNMRQSQFDSHSKFDSRSDNAPRMTGNSLRRLAVVPAFRR